MTPILENAVLGTDLDCQNYDLNNFGPMVPVPVDLVDINDPVFNDPRTPPVGSVTNDSVNVIADIDQSKLALNGVIPAPWLGNSSKQAAQGNLSEFLSRKGAPNGYAGLDINGQVTVTHVSTGPGTGSVSFVGLNVPAPLHSSPPSISTSGTFTVAWNNAPANSWLGATGELDHGYHFRDPEYLTQDFFFELLGNISASKFTTGFLPLATLPVFKPMGSAAPRGGVVPDPGASGDHNMYLGRDRNWHHFVVNNPALVYQPHVPDVTIVLDWWKARVPAEDDPDQSLVHAHITIRSLLDGSSLFYRVTHPGDTPGTFQEALHEDTPDDAHITLEVREHDFIEAWGAKQGYDNSDVEEWEVITPITDLGLP